MSNLDLRAEMCADVAKEVLLHRADYMHIFKDYYEPLYDNAVVWLSTSAYIGAQWFTGKEVSVSRWVYIGDQFLPNERVYVDVSLQVDDLLKDGVRTGLFNAYIANEIARRIQVRTDAHHVAWLTLYAVDHDLGDYNSSELDRLFTTISELGSVSTARHVTLEIPANKKVHISQHEHSHGKLDANAGELPFYISLKDGSTHELVLQQLPSGQYESFYQLSDFKKRVEPILDEENLRRTDEGEIVGYRDIDAKLAVVAEAERSLGIRDLTEDKIQKIESAIEEIKRLA